ncbi:hypothetical protein SAMN04488104_1001157 [Algoriphagus faecimaris]|uniref:6-bladed beta-propeller protein n=1 Tax=Algoriphagus faecimaris TaxID=686796 RepID=A0A1G6MF57_9BACT|nr:6-bladed beta-propeller [Algoriphagus faecimaris]SDC54149.1 hypothetical protein SAMN04488104_1001157 [Algoriphagus faecimaris]
MRNNFLLLIIFLIFSCKNTPNTNSDKFQLRETNFHSLVELQDNLFLLGSPSSFDIMEDGRIVLTDVNSPKMIIYDQGGNQEKVIQADGNGPLQFQNPSIVKYYDGKIYLWCSQQLKLITYTPDGDPIEEFKIFDRAISNFTPFEDKLIAYTKGGFMDSYIQVYDLGLGKLEKSLGEVSNEQVLLDIFSCSGGIDLKNNDLIYIASDELKINKFDLTTMQSIEEISLTDEEFQVGEIKTNPVDMVNSDFNQAVKFINENSTVTGIFALDKGMVLVSEVGYYEGDAQKGITNSSNRFDKYYVLNDNFDLTQVYKSNKILGASPCLMTTKGNSLYQLIQGQKENDEGFVIKTIDF